MRSYLDKNGTALLAASILFLPVILSGTVFAQIPASNNSPITELSAKTTYKSGIEGIVIISPVSPVERPGTINFRPFQADITVLNAAGETVTQFQSLSPKRREVKVYCIQRRTAIFALTLSALPLR